MSDANFLGTLSITGKVGTTEMSKLVQDYKELEKLRKVAEASEIIDQQIMAVDTLANPNHYALHMALKEWKGE